MTSTEMKQTLALRILQIFVQSRTNTDILIMTARHRYDLKEYLALLKKYKHIATN